MVFSTHSSPFDLFPEKRGIYGLQSLCIADPQLEDFPVKGVTLHLEIMLEITKSVAFHKTEETVRKSYGYFGK